MFYEDGADEEDGYDEKYLDDVRHHIVWCIPHHT
jgi:hypothetical protein